MIPSAQQSGGMTYSQTVPGEAADVDKRVGVFSQGDAKLALRR